MPSTKEVLSKWSETYKIIQSDSLILQMRKLRPIEISNLVNVLFFTHFFNGIWDYNLYFLKLLLPLTLVVLYFLLAFLLFLVSFSIAHSYVSVCFRVLPLALSLLLCLLLHPHYMTSTNHFLMINPKYF